METTDGKELKHELGLFDATMIVVGSMIGSGIFIVSADIARTVGSSGYLLLVWLLAGIITLIAALSYGELAGMMPNAGGQYVYLREAYNPFVGFLYGWTLFAVIQTGTIAAVAVGFAKFTGLLLPWFSTKNTLVTILGLPVNSAQLLAIASILLLTGINLRGIKIGKLVQDVFTLTKVLALLILIIIGIGFGLHANMLSINFSDMWNATWTHVKDGKVQWVESLGGLALLAAIGSAMVGSLFSSDAWNNITFIAGEVRNPKKDIPRSLILGTALVTLIYILANIAYLLVLPLHGEPGSASVAGNGIQFAADDRVATAVVNSIFGTGGALFMAVLIMISTFGCNNGLILAGARVLYAMANDSLFFKRAGKLNKASVPGWALIIQAIWASLLCLSGAYGQLLDYVIFAVLIFYIITIYGVFVLRKKRPDAPRPYKVIGYPYLPILYILLASTICIILLVYKPLYTWPGLFIVILGMPVYFFWTRLSGVFRKNK
jgi:APA family basic amino acid/polyamine antiporter